MNDWLLRFCYFHPQVRSWVLREGSDLPKDTQHSTLREATADTPGVLVAQLEKWIWVESENPCWKISSLLFRGTGLKAHPVFSSRGSRGRGETDAILGLAAGGRGPVQGPPGLRAVPGSGWPLGFGAFLAKGPSTLRRNWLGAEDLGSLFSICWSRLVRKSRCKIQVNSSFQRTAHAPGGRPVCAGPPSEAGTGGDTLVGTWGLKAPPEPTNHAKLSADPSCPRVWACSVLSSLARCSLGGKEGRMH